MSRLSRTSLVTIIVVVLLGAATVVSLALQRSPAPQRSGAPAPQRSAAPAPQATPDITGSWERFGAGTIGRGQGTDPRTPPPVPPPPLKAKYLAEWQALQQRAREATAKGQPVGINWVHCLPDGMPGMMQGPFPFEILQTKGQVTIIQESFTQVRRILLDRPQKKLDDVDPSFYGRSVGRWEGDTLVVDTIGIKENVRYQNAPHSDQMRIMERIRLLEPDLLSDTITVEDPVTFEKPWTFTFNYRRLPDYTLLEYICEDNREYIDEKGLQRMRLESQQKP
jgi:hypothetical protein